MAETLFTYCPRCATALVERQIAGHAHRACPTCTFIQFLDPKVVAVVVVEHEGRVLLGRRVMEPARGCWSFVGGYVDRGEVVEDAARREVKEETNVDVTLLGLLGVYSAPGHTDIVIAYIARPTAGIGALTAQAAEVDSLAWFAPDALPPLAFPLDAAIRRDWQRAREIESTKDTIDEPRRNQSG